MRSKRNTGPSRQTKWPAELAMAAEAERRTSCCAPSTRRCAGAGTPRSASAWMAKRIMISGPQIIARVCSGSKPPRPISVVTTPTLPCQSPAARSTVTSTKVSSRQLQRCSCWRIEDVARRARAIEDDEPAVALAVGAGSVDRRAQRREADAAGDDHHVRCLPPLRPARRCRTGRGRRPICPGLQLAQRAGDRADVADGVDQPLRGGRVAADADRHLADAEHVEHVELAGRERERRRSAGVGELQGEGVGEVAASSATTRNGRGSIGPAAGGFAARRAAAAIMRRGVRTCRSSAALPRRGARRSPATNRL